MYYQQNWFWTDPNVILVEPGNRLYDWIEKIGNILAESKTLFLIDDIISDETLGKLRNLLQKLAMLGRHKCQSLWLLMQSYTAVPLNIRDKQICFTFGSRKSEETGILFMKRRTS